MTGNVHKEVGIVPVNSLFFKLLRNVKKKIIKRKHLEEVGKAKIQILQVRHVIPGIWHLIIKEVVMEVTKNK
jgi:hypothetical protein